MLLSIVGIKSAHYHDTIEDLRGKTLPPIDEGLSVNLKTSDFKEYHMLSRGDSYYLDEDTVKDNFKVEPVKVPSFLLDKETKERIFNEVFGDKVALLVSRVAKECHYPDANIDEVAKNISIDDILNSTDCIDMIINAFESYEKEDMEML